VNYLNIDSRERFELVSCAYPVHTGEAAWQKIKKMASGEENYCTVIETDRELEQFEMNQAWDIVEVTSQPGHVELAVESQYGGWLVMRDMWYPGWRASVDTVRVEISQADYLFRAVPVPAGEHLVEFKYRPKSFTIGIIFSMIGIASMVILIWKTKPTVYL
jgi:uncharacterized membrane protein YfhO